MTFAVAVAVCHVSAAAQEQRVYDLSLSAGEWSEWITPLPGFSLDFSWDEEASLDVEFADGGSTRMVWDEGNRHQLDLQHCAFRFQSNGDTKLLLTFLEPPGADSVYIYTLDPTGAWSDWIDMPYRTFWKAWFITPSKYLEYEFKDGAHYRVHVSESRDFGIHSPPGFRLRSAQGGAVTVALSKRRFVESAAPEPVRRLLNASKASTQSDQTTEAPKDDRASSETASWFSCLLVCMVPIAIGLAVWGAVVLIKYKLAFEAKVRELRQFVAQIEVHARLLDDQEYFETRAYKIRDSIMRNEERGYTSDMYHAAQRREEIGRLLGRWQSEPHWRRLLIRVPEAGRAIEILKAEIRLYDRVGQLTDADVAIWRERQAKRFEVAVRTEDEPASADAEEG